jgi:hypothetical protein
MLDLNKKKSFEFYVSSIEYAFKHYIKNYNLFSNFDDGRRKIKVKLFIKFIYFLYFTNYDKIFKIKRKNLDIPNTRILSFVFTFNQALIDKQLKSMINENIVSLNISFKGESKFHISNLSIFLSAISYKHFFELFFYFNKKEFYSKNLFQVVRLVGVIEIYKQYLKKCETVLMYNDHSPLNFLLYKLAKHENKKTVYIQHAPVSNSFPALYNDVNILFSEDSKQKYLIGKKHIKVHTTNDFRFYNKSNFKVKPNNNVLICPNILDDLRFTYILAEKLFNAGYQVTIRPHPRDKRRWVKRKFNKISFNESIWSDLNVNYFVITNESAVPLEAIFNGNLVYKAGFLSSVKLDNYGFLKKKLILIDHKDVYSLVKSIKNKSIEFNERNLEWFIGNYKDIDNELPLLLNGIFENI